MSEETKIQEKEKVENPIAVRDINLDMIQKYVLGTKKNGTPRSIYDVVKDYTIPKKCKKKKKKNKDDNELSPSHAFYLSGHKSSKKKKKKKNKKNNKHWHI